MYHYKATVKRVVDGDTVDMNMDLGFGVSKLVRIRLWGIDAPEVKGDERPEGLAAKAFLETLLPVGASAEVYTEKDKDAGWGRYVGEVYSLTSDHSIEFDISDEMVEAGYAEYKTYD